MAMSEPPSNHQSGSAAGKRQRQALGQELANDTNPSSAEREPRRDFSLTAGGTRQQQPGYIGACNDQHDPDSGKWQIRETA